MPYYFKAKDLNDNAILNSIISGFKSKIEQRETNLISKEDKEAIISCRKLKLHLGHSEYKEYTMEHKDISFGILEKMNMIKQLSTQYKELKIANNIKDEFDDYSHYYSDQSESISDHENQT